jgi:hypothetical protein
MFFFNWLRRQVKAAVLAGCADAVAELHEGDLDAAAALLRQRIEALPGPAPEPENGHGEPVVAARPTRPAAGGKGRKGE